MKERNNTFFFEQANECFNLFIYFHSDGNEHEKATQGQPRMMMTARDFGVK